MGHACTGGHLSRGRGFSRDFFNAQPKHRGENPYKGTRKRRAEMPPGLPADEPAAGFAMHASAERANDPLAQRRIRQATLAGQQVVGHITHLGGGRDHHGHRRVGEDELEQ